MGGDRLQSHPHNVGAVPHRYLCTHRFTMIYPHFCPTKNLLLLLLRSIEWSAAFEDRIRMHTRSPFIGQCVCVASESQVIRVLRSNKRRFICTREDDGFCCGLWFSYHEMYWQTFWCACRLETSLECDLSPPKLMRTLESASAGMAPSFCQLPTQLQRFWRAMNAIPMTAM